MKKEFENIPDLVLFIKCAKYSGIPVGVLNIAQRKAGRSGAQRNCANRPLSARFNGLFIKGFKFKFSY